MASLFTIRSVSFVLDDFSEYAYPYFLRRLSAYGQAHGRVQHSESLSPDSIPLEPLHQVRNLRFAAEQTDIGWFLLYNSLQRRVITLGIAVSNNDEIIGAHLKLTYYTCEVADDDSFGHREASLIGPFDVVIDDRYPEPHDVGQPCQGQCHVTGADDNEARIRLKDVDKHHHLTAADQARRDRPGALSTR